MKSANTPGEILLKEYLEPMGISRGAMAAPSAFSARDQRHRSREAVDHTRHVQFASAPSSVYRTSSGTVSQVECGVHRLAAEREMLTDGILPASSLTPGS